LGYAHHGKPVFPCKRNKEPLTKGWPQKATTDPRKIHAWWHPQKFPGANIGMPTGARSGVWVLDEDPDKGGTESLKALEAKYGPLPATHMVSTGGGGRHHYFTYTGEVEIRNSARKLGPGLDVRGEGGYVLLPGSATDRAYTVANKAEAVAAPGWLVELAREPKVENLKKVERSTPLEDNGGPIPEGTRNDTLTSIAGRLHDGRRDEHQLFTDLMAVNEARCSPPLSAEEVAKIAKSIYGRTPCKAAPEVTPEVGAVVDELLALASERAVKGIRGASGWAIYHAGLDLLRKYGREHPDGLEMDIDMRTWALNAGCCAATVSKFIRRSPLVRFEKRGLGRKRSTVVFKGAPQIGHKGKHSSTRGGSQKNTTPSSVYASALFRTLYRLRWGAGRIGKSRAALLTTVVECPGVSRKELAQRLGRKPESLRAPLKWLVEAGLLLRVSHGRYAVPEDFAQRVDDAREMAGEPLADRLQIARHEREREGYRNRKEMPERAPTEAQMRRRRESYPERRRKAIERAIAALFAARPEYRARRVGQIVCAIIRGYIPEDFPRGDIGMPKDHEVEAILEGEAVA
jgi:Bifunctional DNA primase/polymerase, N-terminal/Primase C terminal 1 (PriCT-1)